jgi:hypothetical protein
MKNMAGLTMFRRPEEMMKRHRTSAVSVQQSAFRQSNWQLANGN